MSPRLESVYEHHDGPYDAAYFSASLMLLPDPAAAVRRVAGLLRPGGTLYATQTFQLRRSRLVERGKPLVRYVTTIEFGRVTYEDDFRACLAAAERGAGRAAHHGGHPPVRAPARDRPAGAAKPEREPVVERVAGYGLSAPPGTCRSPARARCFGDEGEVAAPVEVQARVGDAAGEDPGVDRSG